MPVVVLVLLAVADRRRREVPAAEATAATFHFCTRTQKGDCTIFANPKCLIQITEKVYLRVEVLRVVPHPGRRGRGR